MKFHPVIAALRSDRAPQRRAQEAMAQACEAWRSEPGIAETLEELGAFGRGAPLEACGTLERIFTERAEAERMIGALCRHLAQALMVAPLGHPPLRHGFSGEASTLLLARSGRAQLVLRAREPGQGRIAHVTFRDGLRYEAVLAGEARGSIVRRCGPAGSAPRLYEEPIALGPGARLAFDCRAEALLVEEVDRRLVSLRLHRQSAELAPTTEHDRATGQLLGQSCGDLATSRREMMVALLGRMGRAEAAPLLAEMAREPGDASLRWQALRESLALETATGFAALGAIARRADDPLAANAGALRAQLIEAHPQLRRLEEPQCPA